RSCARAPPRRGAGRGGRSRRRSARDSRGAGAEGGRPARTRAGRASPSRRPRSSRPPALRGGQCNLSRVDGFVTSPGFEEALELELAAVGGSSIDRPGPGLVVAEGVRADGDPAFGLQTLPGAQEVSGASVGKLAKAAFDAIAGPIDGAGPWTLHAF